MNPFKELLLDSLDFHDYVFPEGVATIEQKLAHSYQREFSWSDNPNAHKVWLMGLPPCLNLPYLNSDIHKFYISKVITPLPEDPVDDYWEQLADALKEIINNV